MRRTRRTHSPEFKANVALAACQGDLTMAELVKKLDVHANQITEWKKQLLSNAPDVFGKAAQKTEASEGTIEQVHAKIGRADDGERFFRTRARTDSRAQRKEMVDRMDPLPVTRQCEVLDLPRSTFYHVPSPVSEEEPELIALVDRCHLKLLFYGSRRFRDWLEDRGHRVNRGRSSG